MTQIPDGTLSMNASSDHKPDKTLSIDFSSDTHISYLIIHYQCDTVIHIPDDPLYEYREPKVRTQSRYDISLLVSLPRHDVRVPDIADHLTDEERRQHGGIYTDLDSHRRRKLTK